MDLQSKYPFNRKRSHIVCCSVEEPGFSFEKCCYFLCLYLLIIVATVGTLAFIVVFVLKPRKPIFALQALRLDSFKLDTYSDSHLYASSVVSLVFNAENPNKVGLSYSPSQLNVLYKGVPVGVLEVPKFYQPAHSKNVAVQTRVIFQRVNISQIIGGYLSVSSSSMKSLIRIRIVGDIEARVHVLHVTLPKIKVALDCQMNVNYRKIIVEKEIKFMREYEVLHSNNNSQPVSEKCSIAVYV